MKVIAKQIFVLTIILCSTQLFSQTSTNSPYSRYGLGEINTWGVNQNFAMAGLSAAIQNDSLGPYFINPFNPASYSSIRRTTIEAAGNNKRLMLKSSTGSSKKNIPGIGYVAFAFPITKWWGLAAGLMPYSNVGYKISDTKAVSGYYPVEYIYEGNGGLTKVFLGNGFKIKQLSVGFNASLLFGEIDNTRKVKLPNDSNALSLKTASVTKISDVVLNYGLQYTFNVGKMGRNSSRENAKIIFGVAGNLQSSVSAKNDVVSNTFIYNALNVESAQDTLENFTNRKGAVKLPMSINTGVTLVKGTGFSLGVEYGIETWQNYRFFDEVNQLKQANHFRIGTQFLPKGNTDLSKNFLSRVYYRAGFRYSQLPLVVKNTQITEMAVSAGFAIPVARIRQLQQGSFVNIGVEVGQTGTTKNNLIQEKFVKVSVGITLNDRWFIKPKIN
ncbi:MAG: hypothetical protein J0M08_05245 [Bacteroidetes bacterium]|nr:hypothetical protein [Bacteroidota bacterium]